MNNLLKNLFRKLAPLIITFVAMTGSSTFAQSSSAKLTAAPPRNDIIAGHADIVAPTAEGQLRPNQIVVNRRPEIPYRPFEVVDPKTGKPVSRDTMLAPMPNGQRLTAGQYWDEMNKLEQRLNATGYSLRPGAGEKPGTPRRFQLQQIPTPVATLQRQSQTLSSSYVPNVQFRPMTVAQAVQQQKAIIGIDPGILGAVGGALRPLTLHTVKNWGYTLGDPSTISVSANGKLEVDGTSTSTALDAEATAAGSLFSHSFDILQATGKLNAPQKGQLNITVNASVLGINVYNVNQNATATFTKSDSISKTLDESTSVNFTLIGIPFSAKVGAHGTAGLTYTVTIAPVKAAGVFLPSINTNAYAQVGADIGIASAGVGGKLTILNLNGNLTGNIAIVPDARSKASYSYTAQYCQNLDALDGSIYAFLKVGIDPFSTEFDHTFFSFKGTQSSGCLFNESKTSPVFQQQQANPGKK